MGKRHLARELAMQVIFEMEDSEAEVEQALGYRLTDAGVQEDQAAFCADLVRGTLANITAIDEQIATASTHYRIGQMAKVERAVLRLCTYEILFAHDVPLRAAINESIELAKTFGGDESGRFVNGVQGRIAAGRAAAAVRADPGPTS